MINNQQMLSGCVPIEDGHICFAQLEMPTDDHECREALDSDMIACRRCPNDKCYRQGWLKPRVVADNKRRVKEKRGES